MDFTFLKEDQIWGKNALEVMKRYGTKVAPTDLTVILGGFVSPSDNRTSEGDLTCAYWSTSSSDHSVCCVFTRGDVDLWDTYDRFISARPV